jgi:hypothetical protein
VKSTHPPARRPRVFSKTSVHRFRGFFF